jgi:hypothetical protein
MSLIKNYDFSDYKKTLEDLLQNISFLYSGDVISSEERTMTMNVKHNSFSPDLMRDVLLDIYDDSLTEMMEKSEEFSIASNNLKDIYQLLDMNVNSKYLFYSNNSNLNLNISNHSEGEFGSYFLPSYFNQRIKLSSYGSDVSAYFSPIIKDSIDEYEIFLTDNPIQSLVWSLQNMTYEIIQDYEINKHIVKYRFYHCDYKSVKIVVRSLGKIREKKISSLLNDN